MISMNVFNAQSVKKKLQKQGYMYATQRTRMGLKAGGEYLLKKSKEVCPIKTGKLRRSGYSKVSNKKGELLVEVGYKAEYAFTVHELPQSSIRTPGTTNKYLERPARQYKKEIAKAVYKGAVEGR